MEEAIDAAFGDDADEFASIYEVGKTFAKSNPNCTVEDLPQ